MRPYIFLFFYLFSYFEYIPYVIGVVPTGELKIRQSSELIYVAPSTFGSDLTSESRSTFRKLVEPLGNDKDGCNPSVPRLNKGAQFYLLVSRGNCSFSDKSLAASEAGAKGLIVYNSLEGIYQGNDYASETDYDCDNGMGYVKDLVYPVYSNSMDELMPPSCTKDEKCSSGRCLLTNISDDDNGVKVCCAWDLYITMGGTTTDDFDLPVVFIRMQDADTLFSDPSLSKLTMDVSLYSRSTSSVDFSSVLIWLIAVFTVAIGASKSAEEDRSVHFAMKITDNYDNSEESRSLLQPNQSNLAYQQQSLSESNVSSLNRLSSRVRSSSTSGSIISSSHSELESTNDRPRVGSNTFSPSLASSSTSSNSTSTTINSSSRPPPSSPPHLPLPNSPPAASQAGYSEIPDSMSEMEVDPLNTMDITPLHAVGFILISSSFLILLYFIDLYSFVTYMYLASASVACSAVLFYPIFQSFIDKCRAFNNSTSSIDDQYFSEAGNPFYFRLLWVETDLAMVLSMALSILIVVTWVLIETTNSYAWLLQDLMGISVCILFLTIIRLPNLKVASVLLILAFLYDIFFVFISPYVFSSSVMIDVATGASSSTSTNYHNDENWCEKYPDDEACTTTTLPMMLTVPSFSSYISSDSILGLGDIVLPGLLLVWTARYDMRRFGSLSSESARRGYFPMALFGYSIGLLCANFAVYFFEYGQPALLYIVPLTLGPVLLRAFAAETLSELWERLPKMKLVAFPVGRDEQMHLLSQSDVVEAIATWTPKNRVGGVGVGVVLIDEEEGRSRSDIGDDDDRGGSRGDSQMLH